MDGIEILIKQMMKIVTPETTSEKVVAAIDSIGIVMSILLFGLGWKQYVDGVLSSILLLLTCISVFLTIAFKVWKEYREWNERKENASN